MAKQTRPTNPITKKVLERTDVPMEQAIPLEEMEAKFAEEPAPVAVTYENIEQVIAEAPRVTPAQRLKEMTEGWGESQVSHRLRQSVNFLHAYQLLSDDEARRLKAEIDNLMTAD